MKMTIIDRIAWLQLRKVRLDIMEDKKEILVEQERRKSGKIVVAL